MTKEEFMNASYGVKRLKGMIKFMMSEDWSVRMPEFREYLKTLDKQRGTDFCKTFPEMADLMDESLDNSVPVLTGESVSKKQEAFGCEFVAFAFAASPAVASAADSRGPPSLEAVAPFEPGVPGLRGGDQHGITSRNEPGEAGHCVAKDKRPAPL